MRQAASDGYYEEAREGQIIPEGSRAQPGTPICVGPWLCQLPRTPSTRSSVRVASHRSYRARTAGEEDPTSASSHTNLPKEYAATSDAHTNDAAQPHARRRL